MRSRSNAAHADTRRSTFAAPTLIGLVTTAGLLSALWGDDLWDVLSWWMLGIPVVVSAWYLRHVFRGTGSTTIDKGPIVRARVRTDVSSSESHSPTR